MEMEIIIPSINGTDGAYIGARIQHGGCGMAKTPGLFFWVFPGATMQEKGTYMLTKDLRMFGILCIRFRSNLNRGGFVNLIVEERI